MSKAQSEIPKVKLERYETLVASLLVVERKGATRRSLGTMVKRRLRRFSQRKSALGLR